jgi:lysyl-tRNA synthetase class 2
MEVETPILQSLYGGTNAKPFTTYMNALDSDFYLRVAPELYLKRLIVGGYERVFEIARNFRNEGIDLSHQPEFTMMEFYEAYADYHRIMDLTEDLIKYAAQAVNSDYNLTVMDTVIDISGKWRRITVDEALVEYAGIHWDAITDEEVSQKLKEYSITVNGEYSKAKALFALYDHIVTPQLIEPTWVIDYPREVSPLSHAHRSKQGRVERFEGYVGGKEICDGWSEIISGIEQRERFDTEQRNMRAGDAEAQPLDEEFIEALEYGCPPLGGIGIGIDRLCMLLTNTWAIREVIAFPTLRSKSDEKIETQKNKSEINQKNPNYVPKETGIQDLGISYKNAKELLHEYIKDPITRLHCIESEAIMRELAKHFGEDEEQWGIIGLLHDIDWELTKTDTKFHSIKTAEILKKAGGTDYLISTIQSHVYPNQSESGYMGPPEYIGKQRSARIEHALAAAETLTGLIIATTLVQPDKKLETVKPESLVKKYKSKGFAANCRRDIIAECEQIGIPIDQFLNMGLTALQNIHETLGL